ncbi:MAG TPA: K(+)-transporting ATPase subunit C [Leptolyngbyaceae cyanobacterium]
MRELIVGVRVTIVFWLLTAIIYPLFILAIGQLAFPFQANGSLIKNAAGNPIGSAIIGQTFSAPQYFWSRPSTVNYSEGKDALPTGISGASNLAPSNPDLIDRVRVTTNTLRSEDIQPTGDLVYASGSGLDPHISVNSAIGQIARVAKARNLSTNQVEILVNKYTDDRFLGIFGEPGVNVLKLNLALDSLSSSQR